MSEILGVRIDNIVLAEAKKKILSWLNEPSQKKIFTPNPEMLVLAQNKSYFKEVLNKGDLNLCDGFGITLVSVGKIKRITGSDFVWELCSLAEKNNQSIFLLGSGSDEILEKTKEILNKKFVQLKIAGIDKGPIIKVVDDKIFLNKKENEILLEKINKSNAKILIVAFGQIKQEIWIEQFLLNLPNIKIAIGVGGALDYISGKIKRAPKVLRIIGFEWLWRLIKEPKRIKRIYNATIKFIYYYLK